MGPRSSTASALAVLAAVAVTAAPAAHADPAPAWNGWYKITFHTDGKSGTSVAAGQREEAYTAWYEFRTDCSSGTCVASVADGPTPKSNAEETTEFTWNGSAWTRSATWRWDCLLPDRTITFDQASSVTTYIPQPDGSLTGTISTNIGSGACEGTVYIPVTAVAADPATA